MLNNFIIDGKFMNSVQLCLIFFFFFMNNDVIKIQLTILWHGFLFTYVFS